MAEEAEHPEPEIRRDDHDVACLGEHAAVEEQPAHHGNLRVRRQDLVAAAMEPHHHRQWVRRCGVRCPYVQIQTILIPYHYGGSLVILRRLRAAGPEVAGRSYAGPRHRRLRRAPAQVAHGRRRKRNAEEAAAPAVNLTQCAATTQAGRRCKRKPQAGSQYCWQHQP